MSKDLVPQTQKYQLVSNQKEVDGKLVFDETKPYYNLKILNNMDGILFEEYRSDIQVAKIRKDSMSAYNAFIGICDIVIEEKVNNAPDPKDLEYKESYELGQHCIYINVLKKEDVKK